MTLGEMNEKVFTTSTGARDSGGVDSDGNLNLSR
jgi:hypothetical protein